MVHSYSYRCAGWSSQCHRARKLPHAERPGPLSLCVTSCDDFDLSMSTAEYGGSSGENASGVLNRTDCTEAVGCASGSRLSRLAEACERAVATANPAKPPAAAAAEAAATAWQQEDY